MKPNESAALALAILSGIRERMPSEPDIRSFIDHLNAGEEARVVREVIEVIHQRGNLAAEAVSEAFGEIVSSLERLASGESRKSDWGLVQNFCSHFFSFSLLLASPGRESGAIARAQQPEERGRQLLMLFAENK